MPWRDNSVVMKRIEPEGVELEAIGTLVDLRGLRVLELGCGEGRLTSQLAPLSASLFATDPDPDFVELARTSLPRELAHRVTFAVATAEALEVEPCAFDLAFFSWSL